MADPAPPAIDDETLRAYLAESLPAEEMARVERGLRGSASLRQRLEDVRQDRPESTIHTLGAIWRRARLSCPDREELGSFLIEALDPEHIDYIIFHLEVVECPFCRANLADLRGQFAADTPSTQVRQRRYFQSSRHLLSNDE
ncbi:hypothetical protein [Tautonia sociabilis]|uniref:Uncharacterized protein n=1 Tax=Tautonia sociabilis TaxID=2080755 RepID=A0A432MC18_9BACT|nr:hypothetical protein [Tautonia sociabilis]RUL81425.1 hypothetical protein TsocGM_25010 [Tautonia sociabilis]